MSPPSDLRRHRRKTVEVAVRLCWQDSSGIVRYSKGRCLEISESGLRVETSDPMPLRSYVNFQIDNPPFAGSGSVRHVTRSGLKFVIGLEFAGTLRWRPSGKAPEAR